MLWLHKQFIKNSFFPVPINLAYYSVNGTHIIVFKNFVKKKPQKNMISMFEILIYFSKTCKINKIGNSGSIFNIVIIQNYSSKCDFKTIIYIFENKKDLDNINM